MPQSVGDPVTARGDSFVVHMDRESLGDLDMGRYDVTVTISAYEQDRELLGILERTVRRGYPSGA